MHSRAKSWLRKLWIGGRSRSKGEKHCNRGCSDDPNKAVILFGPFGRTSTRTLLSGKPTKTWCSARTVRRTRPNLVGVDQIKHRKSVRVSITNHTVISPDS